MTTTQRLQSYNHVFSPTFVHHHYNNNKQQQLGKVSLVCAGNSNWCTFLNIIIIMMACLSIKKQKNKLCAGVAEATTTTASVLSGSSSNL